MRSPRKNEQMLLLTCSYVVNATAYSRIFAVSMLYSNNCRASALAQLSAREFFLPQNISSLQARSMPVVRLPENILNHIFQYRVAPGVILRVVRN